MKTLSDQYYIREKNICLSIYGYFQSTRICIQILLNNINIHI